MAHYWNLFIELLVCLLLACGLEGEALEKNWVRDIRFDNKDNWLSRSLPCPKQRIIFFPDTYVYLSSAVAAVEIVLPKNGGVILGARAAISAAGRSRLESIYCDGNDKLFQAGENSHWFNPNNWQTGDNWTQLVMPHSEKVPCPSDRVVFKDRYFMVTIDVPGVSVSYLNIGSKRYSQSSLASLLASEGGKVMFNGTVTVTDGGNSCTDVTGCACGNDDEEKGSIICFQNAGRCPQFSCEDPVQPAGSCCLVCASSLIIEYSIGFRYRSLQQNVDTMSEGTRYQVQTFMHKLSNGSIQIVVMDKSDDKGQAHAFVELLYSKLGGVWKNDLHIDRVFMQSSRNWNAVSHSHTFASGGTNTGIVVGSLIVSALIVALLAFLFTRYRKRFFLRSSSGFIFAKFKDGGIELDLGITPHDELVPSQQDT